MSRSSHQRGFVPNYPFVSAPVINSFNIPRSYNHSSDESEAGSPSGGGGGNGFVPTGHEASLNPNYNPQPDDRPYIPRGATQNTSTRGSRELALPSDSHYEYNYGQIPTSTDGYAFRNPRHAQRHAGNAQNGGPQYDQDLRHTPSEGPNWGDPTYYRPHTSMNSNHNFSGGVSAAFQNSVPSQQQNFGGPQAHITLGHGRQSSESPPSSVDPGALGIPFEDAGEYLRQQLSIPLNRRVDLYALPDPPGGSRPTQPLAILMKLAIYGSPQHKLTLREIYAALEERYEWFRNNTHDSSWKNSIRHHLSLNKVFRNIQRPITEPGKGKYWVLDVSGGEGYKRERKRRNKTKNGSSGSDEEQSYVDEPEDFSEDDRSGSGSPGPSTSRQERARRTRGTPYPPQPSSQFALPPSTMTGLSQMSITDPSSMNGYPTMDLPATQDTLSQNGFYGYPAPRMQTHPSFTQPPPPSARPGASRSQTSPMPGMISTSPGGYGYPGTQVQTGSQQVFRGPLRQSPTEQTYHGLVGSVPSGGYMDPRNAASPYGAQYNQDQYGPSGNMGRGPRERGRGQDRRN